MRSLIAASLLTATLPALAAAQGVRDLAVIMAPNTAAYALGAGAGKRTIVQSSLPIVLSLPVNERLTVDLTTAYASSDVMENGQSLSGIRGLTDTQLRGTFTLGDRFVVFTMGLNLPTGQYTIPEGQQLAAGQIGNDFLNFPVSSMGNGLSGTGGVALARTVGSWNLGAGVSMRKSTRFTAYVSEGTDLRFTPADEYRVNLGVDRPVGAGQVQFGVTYAAFGADDAEGTTYSTGDRIIASGAWNFPVRSSTVFLSGWNLFRLEGAQFNGVAPKENVLNLNGGVSFSAGETLIQPNLEMRLWQVDGAKAGNLLNAGLRARFTLGRFMLIPAGGYAIGTTYSPTDSEDREDVTGYRASLTIRWN